MEKKSTHGAATEGSWWAKPFRVWQQALGGAVETEAPGWLTYFFCPALDAKSFYFKLVSIVPFTNKDLRVSCRVKGQLSQRD